MGGQGDKGRGQGDKGTRGQGQMLQKGYLLTGVLVPWNGAIACVVAYFLYILPNVNNNNNKEVHLRKNT